MSKEDIEEVVADACIKLWYNSEKIMEEGSLKSYLASIARNTAVDRLRKYEMVVSIEEMRMFSFGTFDLIKQVHKQKLDQFENISVWENGDIKIHIYSNVSLGTVRVAMALDTTYYGKEEIGVSRY